MLIEDEMVGRDHQFNGHVFVQTMGNSEREGVLCAAVKKGWT